MSETITNAPAPMIGGITWPPVDADASTPAANCGRNPLAFINGMVMIPVDAVLATAEPDMVPVSPRCDHRNEGGPSPEPAGDDPGEFDHEVGGSRDDQEAAEDHEERDVGRGDGGDDSEHALVV